VLVGAIGQVEVGNQSGELANAALCVAGTMMRFPVLFRCPLSGGSKRNWSVVPSDRSSCQDQ
jgi:hypothetical protein